MKLRNKKTGEIVDVESLGHAESLKKKNGYQVTLSWATEYENLSQCKDYHSLAELNEEWEDYSPPEPLIKDEKIRKAVRAWAEANGIERVWHEYSSCWLRGNGLKIELENEVVDLEQNNYTITELCGEEE